LAVKDTERFTTGFPSLVAQENEALAKAEAELSKHNESYAVLLNKRNVTTEAFAQGITEAFLSGQVSTPMPVNTAKSRILEGKLETAIGRLERSEEENKSMLQRFTILRDSHSKKIDGFKREIEETHRLSTTTHERLRQIDETNHRLEEKIDQLASRLCEAEETKDQLMITLGSQAKTLGDLEDNVAKETADSQDQMEKVLQEVAGLNAKLEIASTQDTAQHSITVAATLDQIQKDILALQEDQQTNAQVLESVQDTLLGQNGDIALGAIGGLEIVLQALQDKIDHKEEDMAAQPVTDKDEVWARVLESSFADVYGDINHLRVELREAFENAPTRGDVCHIKELIEKQIQLNSSFASLKDVVDVKARTEAWANAAKVELENLNLLFNRHKTDGTVESQTSRFTLQGLPSPPLGHTPVLPIQNLPRDAPASIKAGSPDQITGPRVDIESAWQKLQSQVESIERRIEALALQVNELLALQVNDQESSNRSLREGMSRLATQVGYNLKVMQDFMKKIGGSFHNVYSVINANHNDKLKLEAHVNDFIRHENANGATVSQSIEGIQATHANLMQRIDASQINMHRLVAGQRAREANEAAATKSTVDGLARSQQRCLTDMTSDIARLEKRGLGIARYLETTIRNTSVAGRELSRRVGDLQQASRSQTELYNDVAQKVEVIEKRDEVHELKDAIKAHGGVIESYGKELNKLADLVDHLSTDIVSRQAESLEHDISQEQSLKDTNQRIDNTTKEADGRLAEFNLAIEDQKRDVLVQAKSLTKLETETRRAVEDQKQSLENLVEEVKGVDESITRWMVTHEELNKRVKDLESKARNHVKSVAPSALAHTLTPTLAPTPLSTPVPEKHPPYASSSKHPSEKAKKRSASTKASHPPVVKSEQKLAHKLVRVGDTAAASSSGGRSNTSTSRTSTAAKKPMQATFVDLLDDD